MANVKAGNLAKADEMWKHLRHMKKAFWSRHRRVERRLCVDVMKRHEPVNPGAHP